MVTIDEALKEALTPPDHYYGAITDLVKQGWAQVAGMHRDSDTLALSNWDVMLEHYKEKYEENEDFRVEGSSHWLVGWSDCLLVRALQCECEDWEDADFHHRTVALDNETTGKAWICGTCEAEASVRKVFEDAIDFAERLQDYPVLDEEDWSRRETEELMEYLEQEVGKEDAEELATYLFDNHSICNVDDLRDEWIDEWRKQQPKNWRVTVYGTGMKPIDEWEMRDLDEATAEDQAWKEVHARYPDHYDWQLEDDSE